MTTIEHSEFWISRTKSSHLAFVDVDELAAMHKKPVNRALQRYLPNGRFGDVDAVRSRTMRANKSSGTRTTEKRLRAALARAGIHGWMTDCSDVIGRPDFYFERERLAVFVDGCFWHGCPMCSRPPKTNAAYWRAKFDLNRKRDDLVTRRLRRSGHSVIRLWEHQIRDDLAAGVGEIQRRLRQRSK